MRQWWNRWFCFKCKCSKRPPSKTGFGARLQVALLIKGDDFFLLRERAQTLLSRWHHDYSDEIDNVWSYDLSQHALENIRLINSHFEWQGLENPTVLLSILLSTTQWTRDSVRVSFSIRKTFSPIDWLEITSAPRIKYFGPTKSIPNLTSPTLWPRLLPEGTNWETGGTWPTDQSSQILFSLFFIPITIHQCRKSGTEKIRFLYQLIGRVVSVLSLVIYALRYSALRWKPAMGRQSPKMISDLIHSSP